MKSAEIKLIIKKVFLSSKLLTLNSQSGFVAISAVLIILSVVIAIGTTVTYLSIDEAQSGLALYKGEDNLNLVEGCVEDAMLKIRSDSAYAGGTLTRPEGSCTVTINSGNPNWNITVTSTTTTFQRRIQAIFTKSATGITLTSWKEI